ncbi:MAG: hypothetical protein H6779_00385 [Candidatus Nomurabacteria bacterium]|nr:MAG: hypothetical protein H6779_00385 [Candidatus Nomurabacteria bacterium]
MKEKLKSLVQNDQIFYGVLVLLVGIISFYLGQASAITKTPTTSPVQLIEPITLTSSAENAQIDTKPDTQTTPKPVAVRETDQKIVASKNGTRYYLSTCSGVKRIKPENIVTFSTKAAAEAAGYTKAANCPGL